MELAWLIPALPFAAFAIIGLFTGRGVHRANIRQLSGRENLSSLITILAIAASCAISWMLFFRVMNGETFEQQIPWLALDLNQALTFGIRVDPISAVMLVAVTTISLLIQIYSRGYLYIPEGDARGYMGEATDTTVHAPDGHGAGEPSHEATDAAAHPEHPEAGGHGSAGHHASEGLVPDPGFARYFAYMALFTGSMLGLVLANNLLAMYMFWEGVGLGSYLLIGFWYRKPSAAAAAKKAFVTTRFGDFGFLIGILYLFWSTGTLEFSRLAELSADPAFGTVFTIGALLIFAGAVGKSAQFPLHVWLPDAMEGPTPVSALIHAATMVAAGVYLVARAFPIFEHAPGASLAVAFIGGFTAIFAATMGLVATDIKRVVAFSTLSQLGYMMLGLGSGSLGAGMFHLFTHAFFKALLFLTAGSIIIQREHAYDRAGAHEEPSDHPRAVPQVQDLRYMGGLWGRMPITAWTMLIGSLSLAGIPPLAGFWSKDEILLATYERATHGGGAIGWLLLAFAMITVLLTAFYSFRVLFMAFAGPSRGPVDAREVREAPAVMTIPLLLLAIPTILVGLWGAPQLGNPFGHYLEGAEFHGAAMNLGLAAISTVLALAGIGLAWMAHRNGSLVRLAMAETRPGEHPNPIYRTLLNRYWIDELYMWLIDKLIIAVSFGMRWFDEHVVDGAVNGVAWITGRVGNGVRQIQTGRIPAYALAVFGGLAIIAAFAILGPGR